MKDKIIPIKFDPIPAIEIPMVNQIIEIDPEIATIPETIFWKAAVK
jgi:hypothetical protein